MVSWIHLLVAFVWGALCAVERRAFLQAMVSRPLVAATGMGLFLGDLRAGLYTGLVLELYYLGTANLGAARPENESLAATAVSAMAASLVPPYSGHSTPAMWTLALLCLVPMGNLGRLLDAGLEKHSTHLALEAATRAEAGHIPEAVRLNLYGMWPYALTYGGICAGTALLGQLAAPWMEMLPLALLRGLAWAYPAMASVAAAIAARGSRARRSWLYAGAAALIVGAFTLLWPEVGL